MLAGHDSDYGHSAAPGSGRHFHDDRTNAAGRDDDEGIVRTKVEAFQNLLGVSFIFFQVEWGAESVGSDDVGMVGKRQLDQGDETGEASLAGRHFFAQHSRVAVAEQEYQASGGDGGGTDFGGAVDGWKLLFANLAEKVQRFFEVGEGSFHEVLRKPELSCMWNFGSWGLGL